MGTIHVNVRVCTFVYELNVCGGGAVHSVLNMKLLKIFGGISLPEACRIMRVYLHGGGGGAVDSKKIRRFSWLFVLFRFLYVLNGAAHFSYTCSSNSSSSELSEPNIRTQTHTYAIEQ